MTLLRLVSAGDRAVEVHVRRSRRARRLRLWAPPRRPFELVVPWRASAAAVDAFLAASEPWLAARSAEAERPSALGLDRAGVVWLGGEPVPVERKTVGGRQAAAGRPGAALRGGRLVVSGPDAAAVASVERWYRREARARLEASVATEATLLAARPARVTVRDTTSRFGSCSSTGTLSFSWRLVVAPPAVLDYVVVHELCHLLEPNHGAGFWRLVAESRPGFDVQRRWLNEHGRELLAYVPRLEA